MLNTQMVINNLNIQKELDPVIFDKNEKCDNHEKKFHD